MSELQDNLKRQKSANWDAEYRRWKRTGGPKTSEDIAEWHRLHPKPEGYVKPDVAAIPERGITGPEFTKEVTTKAKDIIKSIGTGVAKVADYPRAATRHAIVKKSADTAPETITETETTDTTSEDTSKQPPAAAPPPDPAAALERALKALETRNVKVVGEAREAYNKRMREAHDMHSKLQDRLDNYELFSVFAKLVAQFGMAAQSQAKMKAGTSPGFTRSIANIDTSLEWLRKRAAREFDISREEARHREAQDVATGVRGIQLAGSRIRTTAAAQLKEVNAKPDKAQQALNALNAAYNPDLDDDAKLAKIEVANKLLVNAGLTADAAQRIHDEVVQSLFGVDYLRPDRDPTREEVQTRARKALGVVTLSDAAAELRRRKEEEKKAAQSAPRS